MDTLQVAILPLVAWWVTFKALFDAGSYLNKLRESVVTGYANGQPTSLEHRRAIFFDWRICNVSLLLSAFMYSGINFWMAWYISEDPNFEAAMPILALIGVMTFLGAVLSGVIGTSDKRLMQSALNNHNEHSQNAQDCP